VKANVLLTLSVISVALVSGAGAAERAAAPRLPAPVLERIAALNASALVPAAIPRTFGSDVVLGARVAPSSWADAHGYNIYFTTKKCAGKPECARGELDVLPAKGPPLGVGTLKPVQLADRSTGYTGPFCPQPACADQLILDFVRGGLQYILKLPKGVGLAAGLVIESGLRPAAAFVAHPAPARAPAAARNIPFSVAHVDHDCDTYAADTDVGTATTYVSRGGSEAENGSWKRSSLQANERLQSSKGFTSGDFAAFVTAGKDVVFAQIDHVSASGDGGSRETWCFDDGKLARTSADVVDVSDEVVWHRYRYYAGAVKLTETTRTEDLSKQRHGPVPPVPLDMLPPALYATPERLPLYSVYRSALSGKLDALR